MDFTKFNMDILTSNIKLMKENNKLKEENDKLLDKVTELTIDKNHMVRKETQYKKLIIDGDNKLKTLREHISIKDRIIYSKDLIIEIEQSTNTTLQDKLDKYKEHINIGA